jgi:hypothetical protein
MLAFAKKPSLVLLGVMLIVLCWSIASGGLVPELNADSNSYLGSIFPLAVSLRSSRTLGYIALVNVVRGFSPTLAAMPLVHLLLVDAAVLAFYFGLRKLQAAPWLAAAVAGSLLYFPPMLTHGHIIIPEVAAAAAAVFTIAMLFWATACPRSFAASCGFCLGLLFTYHLRPAYLFLIVLTPLLGLALRYLYAKHHEVPLQLRRFGLKLTALAIVPYLSFCLFRWRMVGHFGLVSFGGMNLIGVAGQFLNEETIVSVPAHLQPWGRKVLQMRAQADDWPPDHAKERLCYRQAEPLYNTVIWGQFLPAYSTLPDAEGTATDASRKCSELSWSLIKARPRLYACWVGDAYRTGLLRLPVLSWYPRLQSFTLHFVTIIGCLGLVRIVQRYKLGRVVANEIQTEGFWFVCGCLALVAVSFALSKLFLICLVEAPLGRYLDAVYLFLPTLAGVLAYGAGRTIWNHAVATVSPANR